MDKSLLKEGDSVAELEESEQRVCALPSYLFLLLAVKCHHSIAASSSLLQHLTSRCLRGWFR